MEATVVSVARRPHPALDDVLRLERAAFAAKTRAARAVLGLSQGQFARHIGLTQKSVHRIEQGAVQPKRRTVLKIQGFWTERGISFENLRSGGFRLAVDADVLLRSQDDEARQRPH
ncbi:MAG: helix-turn-helix transcriptional regulator [Xanthobacteraceae bacterium]|nr:helix-turn-helix transcriptional regulator [Xanthobacteraceae bacterium]